ncbi:MAG TPA: tautomerase family protein [Prolixibacteraceae bacterium]|nr:tautomerase family protein [Prolixibacteraceae bacterium]
MPVVKIELAKGKSKEFKRIFMDAVHESMVETLKIPANDKNIRLMDYDADCFDTKPPYQYFIEIIMFSGRTKETKSKLFRSLVDKLHDKLNIDPQSVFIVINEQPTENWGIRGGISASDVQLDFTIAL